ncbi:PREDICTED: uncharacterized protein LOC104762287 [Camelina sativa]|uniref:Uncharacterized protein LOC104726760 n=1 Tax=Camelina sativa TaxID=90675 RepID=A0ABM0UP37_CAMSA|nr:PREDICTED: uncharacterized protein LOC104726760 [Camelina sativa]XP_010457637.1 PREDICTED: uncharacterized protein LOC104739082 isoform X1 [Camelina sativa]XP_010483851.1 PREDICTED: uncharacterized protein LOC104762287 [Camelina sativa]
MARISLAICLTLLVTLSTVYETQGTFSLPHYLEKFPKVGKDFEAFANKGMSDFLGDLEGMCPKTAEFKNLFATLKDYMASFGSGSSKDIKMELSEKSEKLFRAMSVFDTSKGGTSDDSWNLVDGLLSMGKGLMEMKKSGSQELNFEQRKELIVSMVEWTRGIGLFVKAASESKGQSIDLSSFGIDYDNSVESPIKRAMYETQGTFSLPHYLENLPKKAQDFEPFAYNGMSHFIDSLESKCPATTEFKDFFVKLEDYMAIFKSASSGSKDFKVDMSIKSQRLFKAMSVLTGTQGSGISVDSWRMLDGLLSMGKFLVEMKKHGSNEITFEQRTEMVGSMVQWARAIGLFARVASEKKGKTIDLSPFGIFHARNYGKGNFKTSSEL